MSKKNNKTTNNSLKTPATAPSLDTLAKRADEFFRRPFTPPNVDLLISIPKPYYMWLKRRSGIGGISVEDQINEILATHINILDGIK